MNIPFLDFTIMNGAVDTEIKEAFERVWKSKWYILGEEVKLFEQAYAKFNATECCVGVANGLDALHLALLALKIGPGDEVIVPSNTYIATWLAVSFVGATPVPVEPNPRTYNLDPTKLVQAINPKTRALMPVHLYGQCCEMEAIMRIAKQHNLYVIEDNAQAQGATCQGKKTGSWGDINATSFYPGKNLGALGDAGAITTDSQQYATEIQILRNYGSEKKYHNIRIGYNSRLDELQAAILTSKLNHLTKWNTERQRVANIYNHLLSPLEKEGFIVLPQLADHCTHVYHLYVIQTKGVSDREKLQEHLKAHGIGTLIHYPIPPHLQQAYAHMGYRAGHFPIAEQLANSCLSLPIYPGLTEIQIEYVCNTLGNFYRKTSTT